MSVREQRCITTIDFEAVSIAAYVAVRSFVARPRRVTTTTRNTIRSESRRGSGTSHSSEVADERANWIRLAMRVDVGVGHVWEGGGRRIAQLSASVLKERGVADEGGREAEAEKASHGRRGCLILKQKREREEVGVRRECRRNAAQDQGCAPYINILSLGGEGARHVCWKFEIVAP